MDDLSLPDWEYVSGGEVGATKMGDNYSYTGYAGSVVSYTTNDCATWSFGGGFLSVSGQTCSNSDGTTSSQTCLNGGFQVPLISLTLNKCSTVTVTPAPRGDGGP